MPLSKLGIKHKLEFKGKRGTEDGASIIQAVIDGWDAL